MKLLAQSDDYGISRASALGVVDGIKNGILRNTGFFTNMPWANEVFEWIKPYLEDIAFGIDLNVSTGPSLLGYKKVPTLCHENGEFLGSKEKIALDNAENNYDHTNYDEVFAEFDAQVQRFIEIVGRKPDYIHNHAYVAPTILRASIDIAKKYGCLYTGFVNTFQEVTPAGMGWYIRGGSLDGQRDEKPLEFFLNNEDRYLNSEYVYLVTHCGYVDAEIFRLSSYNICRAIDLEFVTSEKIKQWILDNNVELINFNDVKAAWIEKIDWDDFDCIAHQYKRR